MDNLEMAGYYCLLWMVIIVFSQVVHMISTPLMPGLLLQYHFEHYYQGHFLQLLYHLPCHTAHIYRRSSTCWMTSCFNLFSPSFVVLGIERRASGICGEQSTTKLQTQTDSLIENHKEHIFTLFSQSQIYRGGEGTDNMNLWTRGFFLLFIKINFKWLRQSFEALRISPLPFHGQ